MSASVVQLMIHTTHFRHALRGGRLTRCGFAALLLLISRLNAESHTASPVPTTPTCTPSHELDSLQVEKTHQLQQLQSQLQELGRRWNARPRPTSALDHPIQVPSIDSVTSRDESLNEPPAAVSAHPEIAAPAPVEGVIDRPALAEALLAAGRVEEAARLYSELLAAGAIAADDPWVQFQLAACDRRLGRLAAAQDKYRALVARGHPEWLIPCARWWLTALEDRARLTANTEQLQTLIQQLEHEVNRELSTASSDAVAATPERRD